MSLETQYLPGSMVHMYEFSAVQKDDSDADSGNEEPGTVSEFYSNEAGERQERRFRSLRHKMDKLAERLSALTLPSKQDKVPKGLVDSMPPEGMKLVNVPYI